MPRASSIRLIRPTPLRPEQKKFLEFRGNVRAPPTRFPLPMSLEIYTPPGPKGPVAPKVPISALVRFVTGEALTAASRGARLRSQPARPRIITSEL